MHSFLVEIGLRGPKVGETRVDPKMQAGSKLREIARFMFLSCQSWHTTPKSGWNVRRFEIGGSNLSENASRIKVAGNCPKRAHFKSELVYGAQKSVRRRRTKIAWNRRQKLSCGKLSNSCSFALKIGVGGVQVSFSVPKSNINCSNLGRLCSMTWTSESTGKYFFNKFWPHTLPLWRKNWSSCDTWFYTNFWNCAEFGHLLRKTWQNLSNLVWTSLSQERKKWEHWKVHFQ